VREFLKGLPKNWNTYSSSLRNRLLKLIIETVEIRGSDDIEAVIYWKNGFQQKVIIHRATSNSRLENRWIKDEDRLLRMMFPSSPADTLTNALPGRNLKAITLRARRLNLMRKRGRKLPLRHWTEEDDRQLELYYQEGMNYREIAAKLGRSESSITSRIRDKGLNHSRIDTRKQKPIDWEYYDLVTLHSSPQRGGHRG